MDWALSTAQMTARFAGCASCCRGNSAECCPWWYQQLASSSGWSTRGDKAMRRSPERLLCPIERWPVVQRANMAGRRCMLSFCGLASVEECGCYGGRRNNARYLPSYNLDQDESQRLSIDDQQHSAIARADQSRQSA